MPRNISGYTRLLAGSIEVLAQLLGMAGIADDVEGALAAETGWMIGCHAQKLHQTLNTLKESVGS
jgi:hypothetical protein